MVMVLLSCFSRYGTWPMDIRTCARTERDTCMDSYVTTQIFETDGLPNV